MDGLLLIQNGDHPYTPSRERVSIDRRFPSLPLNILNHSEEQINNASWSTSQTDLPVISQTAVGIGENPYQAVSPYQPGLLSYNYIYQALLLPFIDFLPRINTHPTRYTTPPSVAMPPVAPHLGDFVWPF